LEKNLIYLGNSLSELVQLKTLVFGTRFCNGKDRSLDEEKGDGFLRANTIKNIRNINYFKKFWKYQRRS
jgi:hypothetical protein